MDRVNVSQCLKRTKVLNTKFYFGHDSVPHRVNSKCFSFVLRIAEKFGDGGDDYPHLISHTQLNCDKNKENNDILNVSFLWRHTPVRTQQLQLAMCVRVVRAMRAILWTHSVILCDSHTHNSIMTINLFLWRQFIICDIPSLCVPMSVSVCISHYLPSTHTERELQFTRIHVCLYKNNKKFNEKRPLDLSVNPKGMKWEERMTTKHRNVKRSIFVLLMSSL